MREPPRWLDGVAVLGAAMIHAVLDKTYRQHQASARRYAGETLQNRIVDGANLVEAAVRRDQVDRERLQEIAADGAGEGMTDESKTMLARGGCRKMRADNARKNLNNKIG
jgi:hypothetical protein